MDSFDGLFLKEKFSYVGIARQLRKAFIQSQICWLKLSRNDSYLDNWIS